VKLYFTMYIELRETSFPRVGFMARRACKVCKRIGKSTKCAICKNETTTSFQGIVAIFDVESEIAKKLSINEPGVYAIKV